MKAVIGLVKFSLLMVLVYGCVDQSVYEDEDYEDTCTCGDPTDILFFKHQPPPIITKVYGCVYDFNCQCGIGAHLLAFDMDTCGFFRFEKPDVTGIPFPTTSAWIDLPYHDGMAPVNIFETMGFQCRNGSWYITKFPYGIRFYNSDSDNFLMNETAIGTSVQARLNPQTSHC